MYRNSIEIPPHLLEKEILEIDVNSCFLFFRLCAMSKGHGQVSCTLARLERMLPLTIKEIRGALKRLERAQIITTETNKTGTTIFLGGR